MIWEDFRERFEAEKLPSLASRTGDTYRVALNQVERHLRPKRLSDVKAAKLSLFQAKLRETGIREATIAKHLRHVKGALSWAKAVGLIGETPRIVMPRRGRHAKLMRGRPIGAEEFERMIAKTVSVVGVAAAPSWQFYLKGVWWSGLRLKESLDLYWDRHDRLSIDDAGQWPMLRIPAHLEKGNKDRMLPMAPEFARLLEHVAVEDRTGRVFKVIGLRGEVIEGRADWIGKVCCRIGRAAGIKVDQDAETGKVKYASLHDLRRSFGERWSKRLMPQELKELMRHESIETTMAYYVGRNAERTAAVLWKAIESEAQSATTPEVER